MQYSTAPGSAIAAETVTVDGVVRSQKDPAGITTTATRPLAIQKDGTWYTYGWDLTKNICELYGTTGYISTTYTYTPFGQVTASGSVTQPIQWSSEINDEDTSLVYYNYRYFDPQNGKWLSFDPLFPKYTNSYLFAKNNPLIFLI